MITRRALIEAGVGACALVATGGLSSVAWGDTGALLRPPGGQNENGVNAACIRCQRCVEVCPGNAIYGATVEDGLFVARTPKLDFHRGYCDFCEGHDSFRCHDVCPTGAFAAFDPSRDAIGIARVDEEACIAWTRGGCDKCFDSCDYGALLVDSSGRPNIDQEACNGCGKCVFSCTANVYRSFSGSNRAIEVYGE